MNVIEYIKETKYRLERQYPFLSDWTVDFDHAKKRAGLCKMSSKTISISNYHIENNSLSTVKDTVLHEFAHAIAFEIYGETAHGRDWKKVAETLGAQTKARGMFNLPAAPWALVHACSKTLDVSYISPRFRKNKKIKNYFLIGRPETKGELYFMKQSEFNEFKQGLRERNRLVLIQ